VLAGAGYFLWWTRG